MLTLGKEPHQLILMTYREFCNHTGNVQHASYQQGYHAGNQAKNAARRKGNETERLLAAIAPSVVLRSRNAETYERPAPVVSFVDDGTPFGFNVKKSEAEDAA